MLSANEIRSLPMLETPENVRIMFTKTGSLKYISHLDLQRTLTRCLIRSHLPVWYTKGFNPHTKLVFSLPLSVGCESICEFVDIKIERRISHQQIKKLLSAQMTDEMIILDVYTPCEKFSEIAYAEYECRITSKAITADTAKAVEEFLSTSPVTMLKRSKSGEKEVDIIPFIKKVSCEIEDGALKLSMILSASSTEGSLNPEYPIKAVCEKFSLLQNETEDYYSLVRRDVLKKDLTQFS